MNAEHERAKALRERSESWRKDGLIDAAKESALAAELAHPWRTHGFIVQAVFFVLTALAMGAFYLLLEAFDLPGNVLLGAISIALAEVLIGKYRWHGTGVEAALWLGGVFSLITSLPNSGKPEAFLVLVAGAAIAGARLRNPLFGALAAVLLTVYLEERFDLGLLAALLIAAGALLALLRTWKRPSTEWLFIVLLLVLPIAGRFEADDEWRRLTIALYAAFGAACLVAALLKKHHALFLAAALGLGIAATDFARTLFAPAEAKLFAAGAFLLVASWIVSRALRDNTSGFVATPARLTTADEELQIAATVIATPPSGGQSEPIAETRPQGSGSFGGAGATGEF